MNIHEKLIEVRKKLPYLQRTEESKDAGFKYKYASGAQALSIVQAAMNEVKLTLTMSTSINSTYPYKHEYRNSTEEGTAVLIDFVFTFTDAEKPEDTIVITFTGGGEDPNISKAIGKCLTYTERYFILKTFQVATDDDDPDKFGNGEPKGKHEGTRAASKPDGKLVMWMGKSKGQPVETIPIDQLESAIAWCRKNDKFLDKAAELQAYIDTYHSTPGAPVDQGDGLPF